LGPIAGGFRVRPAGVADAGLQISHRVGADINGKGCNGCNKTS
jgi:hypothetical protein